MYIGNESKHTHIMKTHILLVGLALGAFTFTSCDKDWTCECITTDADGNEISRDSYKIEDQTADEAKASCEENSGGIAGVNRECNIEIF